MSEQNKAEKNKKYEPLKHSNKKLFVLSNLASALNAAKQEYDEMGIDLAKGDIHKDREGMVGFNAFFVDTKIIIKYHTPVRFDEIKSAKFEAEVEDGIADVVRVLKKHYKEISGSSVTLTKEGDPDITLEAASLKNAWITAKQIYNIDTTD